MLPESRVLKKKDKKAASEGQIEDSEEGVSEKKSFLRKIFSLKFMIIFFIAMLIVAGASFAGWFFFLKEKNPEQENMAADSASVEASQLEDGEELPPPEPDFPDVVDLEPFEEIRIKESGNLSHITFKISIALVNPELREAFESNMELVRQTVESEVKPMTWLVLRTPEGKLRFKYGLIKQLNTALPSAMVKNIFIVMFVLH